MCIIFYFGTINKEQKLEIYFISKTYVNVISSADFDNVRLDEGVKEDIWFCNAISLRDEQDALCFVVDSDSIWSVSVCFKPVLPSIIKFAIRILQSSH